MGSKGDLLREDIVSEARGAQDKAFRVLLAAVVEADGWAGKYVYAYRVIKHANSSGAIISDEQDFGALEEYLDGKGYIAEGGDDCGMFVITPKGMGEATRRPSTKNTYGARPDCKNFGSLSFHLGLERVA